MSWAGVQHDTWEVRMRRFWWVEPLALAKLLGMLGGLGVVAYLDYRFAGVLPISHLYYLPILLAAVSSGYAGGLLAATGAIALFHVTHFVAIGAPVHLDEADVLRFALYLIVGLATARLVEGRRRVARLAEDLQARNAELGRLNARLAELSEARADFVAIASHELRTPLTTIFGSADLLAILLAQKPPADPERLARLAAHISNSARTLRRTVETMLDGALIESGRFSISRQEVRLSEVLDECAETFASCGAERLVLPEPRPELVLWADQAKLAQVLTNLVGNALKYSPYGSPVRIGLETHSDRVLITVSDHGLGIAPEELPRVFERYYRADDERVRAARGAGLGLSISRDIVRAHGGEIAAASVLGEGSVFTVALPVRAEGSPGGDVKVGPTRVQQAWRPATLTSSVRG
jgi:signal transduction histidine kinase